MPRRRKLREVELQIWLQRLPQWKRRALQLLAQQEKPLTTGDLLDKLLEEGHQTTLAALYHFLSRLARKGIVESYKVFMSNKRAWLLKEQYREKIR
ncbi:MAG: hypothetical protein GSR81_02445 [Desulfurococcales archaeon]|nr:hypothetical protein [Desulfurococcales archaeon]